MDFEKTRSPRRQRPERLPAAPRDVVVQMARRSGGQRDVRRHPAADERLGVAELHDRARWRRQHEARRAQAHPAEIVAPPHPLRRGRAGVELAQEKTRRRIVTLVAEKFDEPARRQRPQRMEHAVQRPDLQAGVRRHAFARGDHRRPLAVVKAGLPPATGQRPGVAPFDPAQLRVHPPHARLVAVQPPSCPEDRDVRARRLRAQGNGQERRGVQQQPGVRADVVHVRGQQMAARRQMQAARLVFRPPRQKARRSFGKPFAVEPHRKPARAAKTQGHVRGALQVEPPAERAVSVRLGRGRRQPELRQVGHGGWKRSARWMAQADGAGAKTRRTASRYA